jgi:DNA repair protein RadC
MARRRGAVPSVPAMAATVPHRRALPSPMTAIPAGQRPRERLVELGPESLADAELLAVLLGTGARGASALALAHALLAEYGGPPGLARALPEELARRPGVGPVKAARVAAAFGLGRRLGGPLRGVVVSSTADVAEVVRPWLVDARRERVVLVVCDAGLRVRRAFVLTEGASDECLLPVRDVLTAVLLHDGASFAVAHNHPSGGVRPSAADERVTGVLADGAEAVGLELLAHLVVAGRSWRACEPRGP